MRFLLRKASAARETCLPIRLWLILGSLLITAATLAIFVADLYFLVLKQIAAAEEKQEMDRAATQAYAYVESLLQRVELIVSRNRQWGANGVITLDDVERFNRVLRPYLDTGPGITLIAIAQESGREILLASRPDGTWFNRLTDPAKPGRPARLITWRGDEAARRAARHRLRRAAPALVYGRDGIEE